VEDGEYGRETQRHEHSGAVRTPGWSAEALHDGYRGAC
jgi:hypothetical protein